MFASIGILLGGCSTVRLEDVPSTSAIDTAATSTQANLIIPPGFAEVAVVEPIAAKMFPGDAPETAQAPPGPGTEWRVHYRENGFDAENAAGDTCSGWLAYGESGPRAGQSVKMACSDGRMASLMIGGAEGPVRTGTVMFGNASETAVIQDN